MKAVCISCFNYYENRIKHIESFLVNKGYEVIYITSDFDHIKKKKYTIEKTNVHQIRTLPYYKNLSFRRLLSHYLFSKKVTDYLNQVKPDLIYAIIPPNYLVKDIAKYKQRNNVKLVYDVYDLWPETFPYGKAKLLLSLPFKFWRGLRDNYLTYGDLIITECNLFKEQLEERINRIKTETLYLTKEEPKLENARSNQNLNYSNSESINICYLGSINNIIDIALIGAVLSAINKIKPVTLHIIGDGENREQFVSTIRDLNINVVFHGKIYDEEKKREIFDQCTFGLNLMKNTVCVGLTMKSIDYFQAGVPILNNIKADTADLIEKYKIGFNIKYENIEEVAGRVANISLSDLQYKKQKTREVFNNLFSLNVFNEKLENLLKEVG